MSLRSITNQLNVMQSRRMNPENIAMETMQLRSTAYDLAKSIVPLEDRINMFEKKVSQLTGNAKKEGTLTAARNFQQATRKRLDDVTRSMQNMSVLSDRNKKVLSSVQNEIGLFRAQRKVQEKTSTKLATENKLLKKQVELLANRLKKLEKKPTRRAPGSQQIKGYRFREDRVPSLLEDEKERAGYGSISGGLFGAAGLLGLALIPGMWDKLKEQLTGTPSTSTEPVQAETTPAASSTATPTAGQGTATSAQDKPKPAPVASATPVNRPETVSNNSALIGAAAAVGVSEPARRKAKQVKKPKGATRVQGSATVSEKDKVVKVQEVKNAKKFQIFAKAAKAAARIAGPAAVAAVVYNTIQINGLMEDRATKKISEKEFKEKVMPYYSEIASAIGGAGVGAITGAAAGTLGAGPIGTFVGAAAGGVLGYAAGSLFGTDMGELLFNAVEGIKGTVTAEIAAQLPDGTNYEGLRLKSSEATAGGAAEVPTVQFAKLVAELLGADGYKYFSGFNDTYKREGRTHAAGKAFDLVLNDKSQSAAVTAQLIKLADEKGFKVRVIDEYKYPSSRATAGHIHVEVLGTGTGSSTAEPVGELEKQTVSKATEAGAAPTVVVTANETGAASVTRTVAATPTAVPAPTTEIVSKVSEMRSQDSGAQVAVAQPPKSQQVDTKLDEMKESVVAQTKELLDKINVAQAMAAASYAGVSSVGNNLQKTASNLRDVTKHIRNNDGTDFNVVNTQMMPSMRAQV